MATGLRDAFATALVTTAARFSAVNGVPVAASRYARFISVWQPAPALARCGTSLARFAPLGTLKAYSLSIALLLVSGCLSGRDKTRSTRHCIQHRLAVIVIGATVRQRASK